MKNTPSLTLKLTTPSGLELATWELPAPLTSPRPDMPATMLDVQRFERLITRAVQAFHREYMHGIQTRQPTQEERLET